MNMIGIQYILIQYSQVGHKNEKSPLLSVFFFLEKNLIKNVFSKWTY